MDAASVLRDVTEQAAAMGTENKIDVSMELEADALPVPANETRLQRLRLILVDNAGKFTPFGSGVSVTGRWTLNRPYVA